MEVFSSSGCTNSKAGIFQYPVMSRFTQSSDSTAESITLRSRHHNTVNCCNGIKNSAAKSSKDLKNCNNNKNNSIETTTSHNEIKTNDDTRNSHIKEIQTGLNGITKPNISEVEASPRMKELFQGLNEPGDSRNPAEPPEWLDRDLFNQGRKFYKKYLFCIFFSELLSLIIMVSISRILRPLIYTSKSDTPIRALKRYVSTVKHIIAWYTGDVWEPNDPAHKDLLSIRSIHNKSADTFNSSKHYDKLERLSVTERGHIEPSCPLSPAIRQDLQPQARPGICLESSDNPTLYISQWDMTITQYSFMGLMLAHPHNMGVWWATDKDLEGFVHFWRGIGFLLGIEDKYNFCKGSVAETKALCLEIEELIVLPELSSADWNQEHMASSLITGINQMMPGLSYPSMFRFLADTLKVSVPAFTKRMSLMQTFKYWTMRFVMHILFLAPGIHHIFNQFLLAAIRIIQTQSIFVAPDE